MIQMGGRGSTGFNRKVEEKNEVLHCMQNMIVITYIFLTPVKLRLARKYSSALFKQRPHYRINIIVVRNLSETVKALKKRHSGRKTECTWEPKPRPMSKRTSERVRRTQCDRLPLFIRRKSETRFHRFCQDDNITAVQIVIVTTTSNITRHTLSLSLSWPIRVAPHTAHTVHIAQYR